MQNAEREEEKNTEPSAATTEQCAIFNGKSFENQKIKKAGKTMEESGL